MVFKLLLMSSPGEDRDWPVFDFIAEHLAEVLAEAQTEAVLICAVTKHRRTHCLCNSR